MAVLQIIPSSEKFHTQSNNPKYVLEHSVCREVQDVSVFLQHFSQGLLKQLQFGNLHLISALLICNVHFNCSPFTVEIGYSQASIFIVGHFKFPIQDDRPEHSQQVTLLGECQLKVFEAFFSRASKRVAFRKFAGSTSAFNFNGHFNCSHLLRQQNASFIPYQLSDRCKSRSMANKTIYLTIIHICAS